MPRANFQNHLQVWGKLLPVGFHKLVRTHVDTAPEELLRLFLAGQYSGGRPMTLQELRVTEGEVLEYIEAVRASYRRYQC